MIVKTHQVIWYICLVIEVILIFRTLFKLLGANVESLFVSFIYGVSDVFAYPFLKMFDSSIVNKTEFEWSIYVAMLVYIIAAWIIVSLIKIAKPESRQELDEKL
ncbi:YggT family protein [Candidatus Microgenomates bacterium]|nr:YggT family protein [Candidatus Microgenomates bacterium]